MKLKLLQRIQSKQIAEFQKHRGFTLIELLVVITIIAILAGAAFPVVNGVMAKARKVKALSVVKDIQVAVKSYQTEYNRYPATGTADTTIDTSDSNFVAVLLGEQGSGVTNPREIKFIDLSIAKSGKGGLVGSMGSQTLVDEWGEPYTVIMDTNYDNRIQNPDSANSDPTISSGVSPQLPSGVAVFSNGPDKQEATKDDVVSWRN